MHNAKAVSTLIAPHFKLSAAQCPSTDQDIEYMSKVPYSIVVGSLMYVMVCSRLDLSYAMSLVSRYMSNLGKEYWRAVQWIFRYIRGTTNSYLKFGRTKKDLLVMWIQIILLIWIDASHSLVMCSQLAIVL